jgi:hypothetical protein
MSFSGMGTEVSEGYSLLMKVALCYSALESLESTFVSSQGPRLEFVKVIDADLANQFRGNHLAKLMEDLDSTLTGKPIKRDLGAIRFSDSTDVRPVAQAIRNAVFHPKVTPSGLQLASAKRKMALYQLSKSVIDQVDSAFSERFQLYLAGKISLNSVPDNKDHQ